MIIKLMSREKRKTYKVKKNNLYVHHKRSTQGFGRKINERVDRRFQIERQIKSFDVREDF